MVDIHNVRAKLCALLETVSWINDHFHTFDIPPIAALFVIYNEYVVNPYRKGTLLRRHRLMIADIREAPRDIKEE